MYCLHWAQIWPRKATALRRSTPQRRDLGVAASLPDSAVSLEVLATCPDVSLACCLFAACL
jgi:hypothetical protein